jgi:hypothetical protein
MTVSVRQDLPGAVGSVLSSHDRSTVEHQQVPKTVPGRRGEIRHGFQVRDAVPIDPLQQLIGDVSRKIVRFEERPQFTGRALEDVQWFNH